MTFVQIGEFDWLSGRQKGSIFVKMFKNLLLRNHKGMKLKLGIHAEYIRLYKSCVFYSGRIRTLVAMATYSSHRLIMGKEEIDNFFCLIGYIWNFFYRNVYLVVLYVSYDFCPNR